MHDIKAVREKPDAFDTAMATRGVEIQGLVSTGGITFPAPDETPSSFLLRVDERKRDAISKQQSAQQQVKELSKRFGQLQTRKKSKSTEGLEYNQILMDETVIKNDVDQFKRQVSQFQNEADEYDRILKHLLLSLPNVPYRDVPEGKSEDNNKLIDDWGTPPSFDFEPQEHADFAPALGMDFETGVALSGARFTFLRGDMARLHRAIGQFMIDRQTRQNGYTECTPPLLVRDEAMYGTGQLPKFGEDAFRTTDDRWLISTSEISLTNSVAGQIVDAARFPLRMTALTQCFRSEAGSAGRDTRGFIRQHQFEKCELVSICAPDQWEAEFDHMLASAQGILEALELPYRTMFLCAGDMGFGARKTYDLEVWLPGQDTYREISSVSWCGTFQGRRMNARYRPEGEKKTEFVHTLNGSGLAVGRTLVAILENNQQADGSVAVPEALAPYMGGVTKLEPAA